MNISRIFALGLKSPLFKGSKKVLNYAKTTTMALAMTANVEASCPRVSDQVFRADTCYLKNDIPMSILKSVNNARAESISKNSIKKDIDTGKFLKSLKDNKPMLMKDLKINSTKYDEYCELSKKAGRENYTNISVFDPGCVSEPDYTYIPEGLEDFRVLSSFYSKNAYKPLDMDLLDIIKPNEAEKKMFKKYDIDCMGDEFTPDKRAIAAIIHINRLEKSYPNYVNKIKSLKPDLKDENIQTSIKNAERILKSEELSQKALAQLELSNIFERYKVIDDIGITSDFLPETDINDLRTYAKTVILDKEDYILNTWCGNPVIPAGKNKDKAVLNIIKSILLK